MNTPTNAATSLVASPCTDYIRVSTVVTLDAEAADCLGDELMAQGALSVDFSDAHAGTPEEAAQYGEPGMASVDGPQWPALRLVVLFQASLSDPEARVRRALAQVQVTDAALTIDSLADADWVRNTQALYQPIALGERLAIVPTWHDPLPGRICIRLDPGVAFGSGSHATTQLCLLWLEARVSAADSVIDYGTGSGVLAIAAARLGAKAVTATDIDPQALEAALYNAAQNRVQIALQAVDTPLAPADMLIANILTQPLLLLAPAFAAAVRPAGLLALSGILVAQADEVTAAYAPWFELAPWRSQEGWILLSGPRR